MENKDIHFEDATIKDIRTKLNESYHSESYGDESETPNQQIANYVNKLIVKEVEKQYNIRQYHEKYNIPYPMSEVKRKQHRLKRKKLKKLNRK